MWLVFSPLLAALPLERLTSELVMHEDSETHVVCFLYSTLELLKLDRFVKVKTFHTSSTMHMECSPPSVCTSLRRYM